MFQFRRLPGEAEKAILVNHELAHDNRQPSKNEPGEELKRAVHQLEVVRLNFNAELFENANERNVTESLSRTERGCMFLCARPAGDSTGPSLRSAAFRVAFELE
jgi:hypothetical protein